MTTTPPATLTAMLAASAATGNGAGIHYEGRTVTYCDLEPESKRIAAGLAALGIGVGDRVGVAQVHVQVVVPDMVHYERFLLGRLTSIPGVTGVQSSFVLRRVVKRTALPLETEALD